MIRRSGMLLAGTLLALVLAPGAGAGTERVEKTLEHELTTNGVLQLENLIGSITLRGGGEGPQVRVTARVVAEAKTADEAQALADGVTLEPQGEATGVRVGFPVQRFTAFRLPTAEGQGRLSRWMAPLLKRDSVAAMYDGVAVQLGRSKGAVALAVHLEVQLPRDSRATVRQRMGTVECTLFRGDLDLENHEGSIQLSRIYGNLEARSAGGDLVLSTAKGTTVVLQTGTGNVELTDIDTDRLTVQTAGGRIDGRTIRSEELDVRGNSGRVALEEFEVRKFHVVTGAGAVDLAPRLQRTREARVESTSGDVTLRLGRVAPFDLAFSSQSGNLSHKELELKVLEHAEAADKFSRGSGGADLQIATTSGDVQLRSD